MIKINLLGEDISCKVIEFRKKTDQGSAKVYEIGDAKVLKMDDYRKRREENKYSNVLVLDVRNTEHSARNYRM